MTPLFSRSDLSLHLRSAEPFVEASSSRRPSFGLGAVATCPRCENAAAMLGRLYGRARVKICPTRVVRLSYLAPDIAQAILDGRQPRDLTADKLLAQA